jgi:diguanylate cyclase (GGDEF)-like protein/PAS domain S-box-containing protein
MPKKKTRKPARRSTAETLKHSRDRVFRALIENAADIITILGADGTIQYESPSVLRVLGFHPEELIGKNAFALVHPEDVPGVQAAFVDVIANKYRGHGIAFRFRHKNGSWRYLELTGTNLLEDAAVEGIVVNSRDVSERNEAQRALRESEERYALAVQAANDGLWDWDLESGQFYFSERWKAMLGYEACEVGDTLSEWFDRVHAEDREHLEWALREHMEGRSTHFESEYRIRLKDGSYRYMLSRGLGLRNPQGHAYRMAGSQSDITDRKRAEEQLIHDAFHDSLTGLPNRALFLDRLKVCMARALRRQDRMFAVIFLDLDRFKVINDSLGHSAGDALLIEIGRILEKCVRPEDTVARMGGDEFTILIESVEDRAEAQGIAQRVRDLLAMPFHIQGREVFTSGSIGIAYNSEERPRPEDFIRDADIAMYHAKSLGKSRTETFDPSMHTRALARLELETDLRSALERDEFVVWYQPIVEISSGELDGFEALVRWQSPKRGFVNPQDFIPLAEETGLIVPLGLVVLRQACRQVAAWQKQSGNADLTVSVNLSTAQFTQADLVERIAEALEETGLAPSSLKLEVTESSVMGDIAEAKRILQQLRRLGIKISLDDFGTGYSSFSYLVQLPIDTLKIDRAFVTGIENDEERVQVVRTIIDLARSLGLHVLAEGVENSGQLAKLSHLKCEHAQGFLFSRPVPAETAGALLMPRALGASAGR